MREFASPVWYPRPTIGNLTDDVVANAETHPGVAVAARRGPDGWVDVSADEFQADVIAIAKGLRASGVAVGDKVALASRTSYLWTVLDYAIWWVGAVTVPAYDSATSEQLRWIVADSDTTLAIVDTMTMGQALQAERPPDSALRGVLCVDAGGIETLRDLGEQITDEDLEKTRASIGPADLASIIYTSGTTGPPKGCMLTHGQLMFEVGAVCLALEEIFGNPIVTTDAAIDADREESPSTLLFLPLAHVFARVVQVACISQRVKLAHAHDTSQLLADLASFRPTFLFAVPRTLERLFDNASQRAAADGRRSVFDAAVRVAVSTSQALDGSGPGVLLRARRAMFDRLVFADYRARLGGRLRYAVTGGAPLGDRLAHFYRGVGICVLEGYGLTETAAAVTVNQPSSARFGTVGTPIPGTTVRVADDGELLFRGGQLFDGYWRGQAGSDDPDGGVYVDPDGWLHTGDVGELDDEGFVRVTGRKTEILVTAGGKSVAPAVLEERVRGHELIAQCMVVGEGQPYVAALVTIDRAALASWRSAGGRNESIDDLVHDPAVTALVQAAVDDANTVVSQAEAIRRFVVLDAEWTELSGELTPTLKLRRHLLLRRYRDEVASLYV